MPNEVVSGNAQRSYGSGYFQFRLRGCKKMVLVFIQQEFDTVNMALKAPNIEVPNAEF